MFTTNGKGRFFGTASYALASAGGGGGSGTVSGTTNYIAKFTSTTAVGNSIIYDTGTNIGIGTTSPTAKLHVSASGTLNKAISLFQGGNVGIGTTLPSASLHLYRSGSNLSVLKTDGGTGTLFSVNDIMTGSIFTVNDVSGLPVVDVWSDDRVFMGKYNAYDFVISGSRVGIGTSNPSQKLQVSGSMRLNGAYYDGNNSAGTSGSVLYTTGTKTVWKTVPNSSNIWISAGEMIPRSFSGSGVNSVELTGSARPNYDVLEFDAGIAEYAQVIRVLPNNWSGTSTVTGKFYWTATGGSGAVVWGLRGRCYSDDNPINSGGTLGTGQTATDTLLKAYDMHISPATSAVTISGSLANGKPIIFEVYRDATNGSDTLAVDAQLLGVEITYS
jgi:hypothetical protein